MSEVAFTITLEKKNPHRLVRHTWGELKPNLRVVSSKKRYNRQQSKTETRALLMEH